MSAESSRCMQNVWCIAWLIKNKTRVPTCAGAAFGRGSMGGAVKGVLWGVWGDQGS